MNLGEYIKKLRTEKEMSQRDLASKTGLSSPEISKIETGERKNPSPSVLKSLSAPLGVSYEDLLQKAGYIEEIIDHKGYTETLYRDANGNLVDIVKQAKRLVERDKLWAEVAFRVADEALTNDELKIIRAQTESLLKQFLENKNK